MVRTQVCLEASDHRALKAEARKQGVSMAELLRRIVALHVGGRAGEAAFPKESVLSFVDPQPQRQIHHGRAPR